MLKFQKYHGAGNDFIMIDNRDGIFDVQDSERIKALCHRRFGVGADGIFLLEKSGKYDFKMIFANNDGSMGAMCGNGARCIVHFAHNILKIIKDPKNVVFEAVDGIHEASIEGNEVRLKMIDVEEIGERNGLIFLCSGTAPHNIKYVEDLKNYPVIEEGRKIRNLDKEGLDVNFVEIKDNALHMRTYERGVEDETWACGTGATCAAIATHYLGKIKGSPVKIKMPGGDLTIEFEKVREKKYENIWLTGPAVCSFEGETTL